MTLVAQNIAVLLIISSCIVFVVWQIAQAFRGRKSKLGSCCATGCDAVLKSQQANEPKPAPVQFLPIGNIRHVPRKTS